MERRISVPAATAADAALAVKAARQGFLAWSRTPLHERARVLTRFAQAAEQRRAELGAIGASQYRTVEMPFGGYKKSGIGREGISHTLEEMSQVKTIALKRAFAPRKG